MLKVMLHNEKDDYTKMQGVFTFLPDEDEFARLILPSRRTMGGQFLLLLEKLFTDMHESRNELFYWFKDKMEPYLKNPDYGMWSDEPWILTDKINEYVALEGLVQPNEEGILVDFGWEYHTLHKENLMFALMILIQNGYYNLKIRDKKKAKAFKEDVSWKLSFSGGFFNEIIRRYGDEEENKYETVFLDYDSHWYDGLFNLEAFNPEMVKSCETYSDFAHIYGQSLVSRNWLLVNRDGVWLDFSGPVYVPAKEIRPNMDKNELHKTVLWTRFGYLPLQFETLDAANDCVKRRFQPMNEAKIKAGFTDEIMHFTQRIVSDDIICFDPPVAWEESRWKSYAVCEDEMAVGGIFALRVSENTRKQIHDYINGNINTEDLFEFFAGCED